METADFFTKTIPGKSAIKIKHTESILMLGSCFAENIGLKLEESKFNVMTNPFGIIYNPISIVKNLKRIVQHQLYSEEELMLNNQNWLSLDHHSFFSNRNKKVCLAKINEQINGASEFLYDTKTIFITFGSALVYEYEGFGIVANCHKIPNKQFTKRLLSVKEILTAFEEIKKELSDFNVVFTVSPVRHLKDGLHENNLSKATLLLAINNLVAQNTNYNYFPAYELVIDELRDYRFYKDDLVHPTGLAINYVWDKFATSYFDEETNGLISQIKKIKTAVKHKPFDFESEAHQKFIEHQISLMNKLSSHYPFLEFTKEKRGLQETS